MKNTVYSLFCTSGQLCTEKNFETTKNAIETNSNKIYI